MRVQKLTIIMLKYSGFDDVIQVSEFKLTILCGGTSMKEAHLLAANQPQRCSSTEKCCREFRGLQIHKY